MAPAIAAARDAWQRGEALAASGDFAGAQSWLDRAHRVAPCDFNIQAALAGVLLRLGRATEARDLFAGLAAQFDRPDIWLGLALAQQAAGDAQAAADAVAMRLSHGVIGANIVPAASRMARAAGFAGICGFDARLRVVSDLPATDLVVRQAGRDLRAGRHGFAARDAAAEPLEVMHRDTGAALLGSPLNPAIVLRIEGVASRLGPNIEGWAWHPGAPDVVPRLCVTTAAGDVVMAVRASALAKKLSFAAPLTRARVFAATLPARTGAVSVAGPSGQVLLGTPIAARIAKLPAVRAARPRARAPGAVCVVIPVFAGTAETLRCVASVLAHAPAGTRVIVVDDAIPDTGLRTALRALQGAGQIEMIPSDPVTLRNRGFVVAANAGMKAAGGCDLILLNADTIVAPGFLQSLRDAAHSADDIGTATPLSNDATIFSYPRPSETGPANMVPDAAQTQVIAGWAAQASAGRLVEVPTAHGFCMFIRAECLASTGPFRADVFAQGYGEENDFCERARALGYRHVAVPEVFVAHVGGVSFGPARADLLVRNLAILDRLHPDYSARVQAFIAADPLHAARARLDAARFAAGRVAAGAVLIITHSAGGGTARVIRDRVQAARARGLRAIVLRPRDGFCMVADGEIDFPDLGAALPAGAAGLRRLLAGERVIEAEIHHMLGHHARVLSLPQDLAVAYDVYVHDWSFICARATFLDGLGRYCGEPGVAGCVRCVAAYGATIEEDIAPAALLARSRALFAGARAVFVPHADGVRRLARHFPGVTVTALNWEDDRRVFPHITRAERRAGRRRIVVIGGIGREKGSDVLLACARDAAARDLDLEFVVAGFTSDDAVLLATGRAFITGAFKPEEAQALITGLDGDLAFLPSVWPETWCYALSDAWQAGLAAVVFDIGALAARVRDTGRGVMLPLSLPAGRVNDELMRLAALAIGARAAQHRRE